MIKVKIEVFDGKPITERTGKSICLAVCSQLPEEDLYMPFYYLNEDCESPGVMVEINDLKKTNDDYFFKCKEGRKYKVSILDYNFQQED